MPKPITLDTLIESALAAVPGLAYKEPRGGHATRAHAAAEIVQSGQIDFLGYTFGGDDYWQIGEYTCSKSAGACNCKDFSAPAVNNGRMCKHRVAAMFVIKLQMAAMDRLKTLMAEAPDGELTIRVDVIYLDKGREYRLCGHHYPGHRWETYPYEEWYTFTDKLFEITLRRAGWGLKCLPTRKSGYSYNYFLSRGIEEGYRLNNMAAQDVDREAQAKRFREIKTVIDMERELETI